MRQREGITEEKQGQKLGFRVVLNENGPQLVGLSGRTLEVWPCKKRCVPGGGLLRLQRPMPGLVSLVPSL